MNLKPFDASGAFVASAVADGEIRKRAARGVGATLFSGGVGLCLQIVSTVILARLLLPKEFGIVAMVTTFSLLLANFGLNGFTEAVIQRPKINRDLVNNLFWINLAFGVLLTLGFAVSGPLIAKFYKTPQAAGVAIGISTTILITALSVQHLALLKRAMRFSAISKNDIVARTISTVISIVLGWAGWGRWALVAGAITLPLSTTVGAWIMCRWIPGRPKRVEGTAPMVWFALNTYGRFSVNYFARNLDNVIVGWKFNAQALGFYKRAYDLFALSAGALVTPLTVVAMSALSRLTDDLVRYRRYLLRALGGVALVGMGLGMDLTLVGRDVIRLLLGPGWEPAGKIFTLFGPGIGVMMLYYTHGWIHLSLGRADRWFRWGLVEMTATALLFVTGLHWGPSGVAAAWTASFWILTLPGLWYAGRPISLGLGTIIGAVWRCAVASSLAALAVAAIVQVFHPFAAVSGSAGAAIRIVAVSSLFISLYFFGVIVLSRGVAPLHEMSTLVGEMIPWAKLMQPLRWGTNKTKTSAIEPSDVENALR